MPASPVARSAERFSGFPEGGYEFFLELQAQQSRAWFLAHKEDYERLWVRPMRALGADLVATLAATYPRIAETPSKLFRVQRDVRFAADTSPYKTNVAMALWTRPSREAEAGMEGDAPMLYLHFGLDGDVVAAGRWQLGKEALAPYRAAVDNPVHGQRLQELVDELADNGFELSSHERLKRVPAPFAQEHPRAELLKLKGIAVSRSDMPEQLMQQPELAEWLAEQYRQPAGLINWMEEVLGVGTA